MTVSATAGPIIVFGNEATPPGTTPRGAQLNPDAGPSLFYAGSGILDPRAAYTYYPGQSPDSPTVLGWQSADIIAIDAAPLAIVVGNIMPSTAVPASGTPLTLVAASAGDITVADPVRNAVTGALTTALRIGPRPVGLSAGSSSYADIWDPATVYSRGVSVTSNGTTLANVTFTINGYDSYGYPQTEAITGPGAGLTVTGKKTWKWIGSIVPTYTVAPGTTAIVNTADLFGFPVRAASFPYITVYWNGALQLTGTILPADAAVATSSTGDVRGTFAASPASNGAIRLVVFITIPVAGMAVTTNAALISGMFGVTPA
jgi:hypothetical protein